MAFVAPPWTAQQTLFWTGILNDPDEPYQTLSFGCLANGPPKPTDGGSNVTAINRPRNKAFTYSVGYNPLGLDVPCRFEAMTDYGQYQAGYPVARAWTANDESDTRSLEYAICVLEWMWGHGKLYANGTKPAHGDPPVVQVSSFFADGHTASNLIPPNFHSETINGIRWLVSNVAYDDSEEGCIRRRDGNRLRQDVVVSLTEYVAVPGAVTSPRQRQQARGTEAGFVTVRASAQYWNIQLLCIRAGINNAADWTQVVRLNPILPQGRIVSYLQTLRLGSQVKIPKSMF